MVMGTIASILVCTGNGEWESDPRKVVCVHPATTAIMDHTSIIVIIIIIFYNVCDTKIINCLNINLSFIPRLLNLLQRV